MNEVSTSPDDSGSPVQRRKGFSHTPPWWVPSNAAWFVTVNCASRGVPQLCGEELNELGNALLRAARFYHEMENPRWFIHSFQLMPDHFHSILTFPSDVSMGKVISSWKGYVTRNHGIKWQSGFFDHRLRDAEQRRLKLEYIRMNPVRKGLCEDPEDWQFSFSYDLLTGAEI